MRKKKTVLLLAALASVICLLAGNAPAQTPGNGLVEPWQVIAFGDSAGAGASDDCRPEAVSLLCDGYNKRLAGFLRADTGHPTTLFNYSVGGYQTGQIYATMRVRTAEMNAAEYLTTDGGGNDWRAARERYKDGTCGGDDNQNCLRRAVALFKANWSGMMNALAANKRPRTVVTVQSYFYPFVRQDLRQNSSDQSGNDYSRLAPYLKQMTDYAKTTAAQKGFNYVDLVPIFNGSYHDPQDPRDLGLVDEGDPLHPNSQGHARIADAYRAFGYAPLYPQRKPRRERGFRVQHGPGSRATPVGAFRGNDETRLRPRHARGPSIPQQID